MRLAPLVVAAAAALIASTGCPPPPPPPIVDAGQPDSGVLGVEGDPCFSPTSTNDCSQGLECALLKDADAGVFACTAPKPSGDPCFFNHNHGEPNPPDDGCLPGLLCSGNDTCILAGELTAPCGSPADCASLNCGSLVDGSGSVCVVNECTAGCPGLQVCKQSGASGQCGLTCADPPGNGQPCVIIGAAGDICAPTTIQCASGLECFEGDPATGVACGVPGNEDDPCNLTTPQDGCRNGLSCNPGSNKCFQP